MHGAALCCDYAAAIRTLVRAAEPDDTYMFGQDTRTGFNVAIGQEKAAAQRVRQLHGQGWCGPRRMRWRR